ncbi:MAG: hypothetical protein U9R47_01525 [Actinomycetota bacterium]|nr:hypothetical protein [Actinomycetota bacterium]
MNLLNSRAAAVACVVVLLLTGCVNEEGSERPLQFESSAEAECIDTIDAVDALPETYQAILDVVALPGPDFRHERGREDPDTGLRFAKMGLVVRAESAATLTVDPGQSAEILIGWDPHESPAEHFIVPACPGEARWVERSDESPWVVYSGGVWVSGPACVALTIEGDGRSEGIVLPIDTDCA